MTAPILAITSGEPAGIGPDICLDLAFADLPCRPVVLCDKTCWRKGPNNSANPSSCATFKPKRLNRCPRVNSKSCIFL